MLASVGILTVSVAIFFLEAPLLLKDKRKNDFWAFSLILIAATGLSMAEALRIPLPSPFDWLLPVLKPVSGWIDNLLK